jgi:hypothetical protein
VWGLKVEGGGRGGFPSKLSNENTFMPLLIGYCEVFFLPRLKVTILFHIVSYQLTTKVLSMVE